MGKTGKVHPICGQCLTLWPSPDDGPSDSPHELFQKFFKCFYGFGE